MSHTAPSLAAEWTGLGCISGCQLSGNVAWDLSHPHTVSDCQDRRSDSALQCLPVGCAELAEPTQANLKAVCRQLALV